MRRALEDLEAASPLSRKTPTSALSRGSLGIDLSTEASLCARLGKELIPECLRLELELRRLTGSGPLSIVCSGYLFSGLPLPCLAVLDSENGSDPVRLIECAVISFAPPSALVAHARDHHRSYAPSSSLEILACVNPSDDDRLVYASKVPDLANTVLAGPNHVDASAKRYGRATRAGVVEGLKRLGSSQSRSILYYAGHALSGGGSVEAALILSDGDILTAEDLFAVGGPDSVIPAPNLVLLAACESSGTAGSALASGLDLRQGNLERRFRCCGNQLGRLDTPFTYWFDRTILNNVATGMSLVEALRDAQLQSLACWRSGQTFEGDVDSDRCRAMPIIWAAYVSTGITTESGQ